MSERAGLLVVGGGPAAHAAVEAFRAAGSGRVVLVSADDRPPYDRPPLSKDFLRGESDESSLPLDPDVLDGVDVRLRTRVVDLTDGVATTDAGDRIPWDTCVLATGSVPVPLDVPGGDEPGLLHLRSADDGVRLRDAAGSARTAVVVGSGFIGCEAASSLARRGLAVTLVSPESVPQVDRLGADVGERIAGWLREDGVDLLTGHEVRRVGRSGNGFELELDDRAVVADLVLVAVGVRQQGDVAATAGAEVRDGRVVVDERMRTGVPGLLAAGDVALAHNASAGRPLAVEHWGEALAMGEVAGTTAAGGDARWDAVPGFWSEIGDRTLKQGAWGDGWDDVRLVERPGGFTAWYGKDGQVVGVVTHEADGDYDRGQDLVRQNASWPPDGT